MLPSSSPTTSPALSLQSYLQILRRHRRLIVVVAVLTTLFAAAPAMLADPVYASDVQVQVSNVNQAGVFSADERTELPADQYLELANELEVLRSAPMRARVEEALGPGAPEFDGPTVEQVGVSQIVKITVTAGDPTVAADVANTYADVFVEDRRSRSVEDLVTKADQLREQSAAASAELDAITARLAAPGTPPAEVTNLQVEQANLIAQIQDYDRRADELSVNAALRGRSTQLISPAELEMDPLSASPVGSGLLGLVLGTLLGIALAVVADLIQDRIGNRDDLAAVRPDLPVLAEVPQSEVDRAGTPSGFAVQEAFRYLRTGVRVFGLNADLRSVLVTSAVGGEGKTATSTSLALAMAESGDRVVLIDADLRRSSVHERFGLPNEIGLSSVVVGDADLDEVTHFVRENLAVIPAGPQVQNPTDILSSEQFQRIVAAVVSQADFVLVDTPPVLPVADALIAGQVVDGAILVTRLGVLRRRSMRELLKRMEEARIPLIGFVANGGAEATPYGHYGVEVQPAPAAT